MATERQGFQPTSPLGSRLVRHRDEILARALAHKAVNVRVFGSVVRGEDNEDSDVDFIVDRLLERHVDIVPARMLKPHVAPSTLRDAVQLFTCSGARE